MSDGINSTLGNAGPCPEVAYAGKTWAISHPTQSAKANLVGIITANATAELKQLQGQLPQDTIAQLWDTLTTKISSRHFHTWQPGWLAVMGGVDADALVLLSLLRVKHPEATEEDARNLHEHCREEVAAAFAQVMPGFFDLWAKEWPPKVPQQARTQMMAGLQARFLSPPETST